MSESAPTPYTLTLRRGDTWTRTITWTEDDGTAIDLTGYTVSFVIGRGFNDDTATEYTQADSEVSVSAADGEVTITLSPAQTRALTKRVYQYELTVTSAGGVATTILDGLLMVEPEVSE